MKIFTRISQIIFICFVVATFLFPRSFASADVYASNDIYCAGDSHYCGVQGLVNVSGATSSCTILGRADRGGQTCNTNDSVMNIRDDYDYVSFDKQQGFLPTTSSYDFNYAYSNGAFFPNSPVVLNFNKVDDNGSADVGTAFYSYQGCPCNYNDVSDPTTSNKSLNCGAAARSAGTALGIANPGDQINLSVTNACKPNNNMASNVTASIGGGAASAFFEETSCNNAAYYNWEIDNGNYFPESYRNRNYIPTARGVCTLDTSSVPTPVLSAAWGDGSTSKTVNLASTTVSDSESFSYSNSGTGTLNVTGCASSASGNASSETGSCSGTNSGSSNVNVSGLTPDTTTNVNLTVNGKNAATNQSLTPPTLLHLTIITAKSASCSATPTVTGTQIVHNGTYTTGSTGYPGDTFVIYGSGFGSSPSVGGLSGGDSVSYGSATQINITLGSVGSRSYTISNGNSNCASASTSATVSSTSCTVPTASLTGGGTYQVGNTINYAWSSTGGNVYSSTYSVSGSSCPAAGTSGGWSVNSSSGSTSAQAASFQAGCSYAITYTATNNAGSCNTSASSNINVIVSSANPPSCPSGTTWNGAACVTDQPADGMSGTITPTPSSCTISSGNSSCNVALSWNTTNPVATSAVTSNGSTLANGNSGSGLNVSIPYSGSRIFYLYNNAVLLDQTTPSASCASGTSWNGSICSSTSGPSATISVTPSTCTIVNSIYDCTAHITWSTSNMGGDNAGLKKSNTDGISVISNDSSGTTASNTTYGVNTFTVFDGTTGQTLASGSTVVSCPSGTTWNGVYCESTTPAPTGTFTAPKGTLYQRTDSVPLSWSATGATSCVATSVPTTYVNKAGVIVTINSPWTGNVATSSGSITVSPPVTTTYTLTCSNSTGNFIKSVQIKAVYPDVGDQ